MYATATDGTKIYYDLVPGERPVLLVHGFAADSARTWVGAGWLRALEGRGVVLVDLRGHGRSDRPDTGYSPEAMAADVAAVLDAAELSTVDAITYSMGGLIGWELARQGRVRRLVLGGIDGRPVSLVDMDGVAACAAGVAGHGLGGEAPVPVLVVAGESDSIAPRRARSPRTWAPGSFRCPGAPTSPPCPAASSSRPRPSSWRSVERWTPPHCESCKRR